MRSRSRDAVTAPPRRSPGERREWRAQSTWFRAETRVSCRANAGFRRREGGRIGKSPVEPDRGCHVRLVRFRLTVDGCSERPRLRLDHRWLSVVLFRGVPWVLPPWRAAAALWTLGEPFERRRALARLLKAARSPAGREFGVCAGSDSTGA